MNLFFSLTFCIIKETSVAVFLIDGNALPLLMEAFVCGGRMPFSEKLLHVCVCVSVCAYTRTHTHLLMGLHLRTQGSSYFKMHVFKKNARVRGHAGEKEKGKGVGRKLFRNLPDSIYN